MKPTFFPLFIREHTFVYPTSCAIASQPVSSATQTTPVKTPVVNSAAVAYSAPTSFSAPSPQSSASAGCPSISSTSSRTSATSKTPRTSWCGMRCATWWVCPPPVRTRFCTGASTKIFGRSSPTFYARREQRLTVGRTAGSSRWVCLLGNCLGGQKTTWWPSPRTTRERRATQRCRCLRNASCWRSSLGGDGTVITEMFKWLERRLGSFVIYL